MSFEVPLMPGRSKSPPGPGAGALLATHAALAVFAGVLGATGAGEKVET
jgi:hypothetical protein